MRAWLTSAYVSLVGGRAGVAACLLIAHLRVCVVGALGAGDRDGLGSQLARADKLGVPYSIIIGQKEVRDETVILRDMASGAQENLPLGQVVAELKSRFGII